MGGAGTAAVDRAFGTDNRLRLIGEFLDASGPVTPENAWLLVYRLLLWTNRTIGLVHCYESDKCQPGHRWYRRSLDFHAWLADRMGASASELGGDVDWLFRKAVAELAVQQAKERTEQAAAQRRGYEHLPNPGEDAELVALVKDVLDPHLAQAVTESDWSELTTRVYDYFRLENKRKNLLGEGFEDTLASIIRRLPGADRLVVMNRALLADIPGFRAQSPSEKAKRVDLVVIGPGGRRSLVTAKWSVRADREEQFRTDFDAYAAANVSGEPFDYVLVTNEFDAARIRAACRQMAANAPLFKSVVHVNPEGLLEAHKESVRGAGAILEHLVAEGRPASLEQWLRTLVA